MQAVDGVVGHRDGVHLVVVRLDGDHRTEHLVAHDLRIGRHVGKHGGLHEVTSIERTLRATGDDAGAVGHGTLDEAGDRCALGSRHQRSQPGRLRLRVTERQPLGGRGSQVERLGERGPRDQQPRPGRAGLTGVEHPGLDAGRDRLLQVGVVEHDAGRLPAELQGHALHRRGGAGGHPGAHRGRSGEGHHVDAGVDHHGLSDHRSLTRHQVEDTVRQAGIEGRVGQEVRRERDLGRLEHHRTARDQGAAHLAQHLVERVVPGGDAGRDPGRLTQDDRVADPLLPRDLVGSIEVGRQHGQAQVDVRLPGDRHRSPDLGDGRLDQQVVARTQPVQPDPQRADPVADRRTGPDREGGAGGCDGVVHLAGSALSARAHGRLGGWVLHVDPPGTAGCLPAATDECGVAGPLAAQRRHAVLPTRSVTAAEFVSASASALSRRVRPCVALSAATASTRRRITASILA